MKQDEMNVRFDIEHFENKDDDIGFYAGFPNYVNLYFRHVSFCLQMIKKKKACNSLSFSFTCCEENTAPLG